MPISKIKPTKTFSCFCMKLRYYLDLSWKLKYFSYTNNGFKNLWILWFFAVELDRKEMKQRHKAMKSLLSVFYRSFKKIQKGCRRTCQVKRLEIDVTLRKFKTSSNVKKNSQRSPRKTISQKPKLIKMGTSDFSSTSLRLKDFVEFAPTSKTRTCRRTLKKRKLTENHSV